MLLLLSLALGALALPLALGLRERLLLSTLGHSVLLVAATVVASLGGALRFSVVLLLWGTTALLLAARIGARHRELRVGLALAWLASVASALLARHRLLDQPLLVTLALALLYGVALLLLVRGSRSGHRDRSADAAAAPWRFPLPLPAARDERLALAIVAAVLALTFSIAVLSVPRVYDALAYHMPRVVYWIDHGSAAFFPTAEPRQNYVSPFAGYVTTHLVLLCGGDRPALLVQWFAFVGILVCATLITDALGGAQRERWLVAALCATLPNLALQAMTALSDVVQTFFVVGAAWLLVRARPLFARPHLDAAAFGLCAGLSVLAKATSAFYLLPFALWWGARQLRHRPFARHFASVLIALSLLVGMNAYHWWQSTVYLGGPFSTGGHVNVLRTDLGPSVALANTLKHASAHLVLPVTLTPVAISLGDGANRLLEAAVRRAHAWLGVDPDAGNLPETVRFSLSLAGGLPPVANSPQSAGSPLHFALGLAGLAVAAIAASKRARSRGRGLGPYLACTVVGVVLFAAVFRWQPWLGRFHLPFLVLTMPLAAVFLIPRIAASLRTGLLVIAGTWALVAVALHQEHDLLTVLTTPRAALNLEAPLVEPLAEALSGTERVGIVAGANVIEYPFLRALRERSPRTEIGRPFVTLGAGARERKDERDFDAMLLITQYHRPHRGMAARIERAGYRPVLENAMGIAYRRDAPQ